MVRALEEVVEKMPKEVQTPLQLFIEKKRAVRRLTDTLYLHHDEAYTTAAKEHLMTKEGAVDYTRLEDAATQEKFAQRMTDFYVTKAREYLGIGKDVKLDANQINMLLMTYAGITKEELQQLVRESGEDFTLEHFKSVADRLKQQVHQRLDATAGSHVKDEHKAGVIKEMGLEDIVDTSRMTTQQLTGLMSIYHANEGVIPPKAYKREIFYRPPTQTQKKAA